MTTINPITKTCNTSAAVATSAIVRGTVTGEELNAWLIRVSEAEIKAQVNDAVWIDSGSNEYGTFHFVAPDAITIELEAEAYVGWIANDRMSLYSGYTSEGHGWEAKVKWSVEGAKSVKLVMEIQATENI